MLTAAMRDLHWHYPGEFLTDVRTSAKALWENNPHITPIEEDAGDVETIECHYPLIHQSNQRPVHFLEAFISFLNDRLCLSIPLTELRGDIYLSPEEMAAPSAVARWCGGEVPFGSSPRAESGITRSSGGTSPAGRRWSITLPVGCSSFRSVSAGTIIRVCVALWICAGGLPSAR